MVIKLSNSTTNLSKNLKKIQGMVLLIVLWVMLLISFIVITMNFQANNSILQAQLTKEKLEAKALAQAAIYYAYTRLELNSPDYPISLSGVPIQLNQWGIPVQIAFRGVDGFINPNIANQNLLTALIEGLAKQQGIKADATQIADTIIKWRENATNNGNLKRVQFFALEELRLINVINEDIYRAMLPFLSLYAQGSQVNPDYASIELLQVLFPNDLEAMANYVNERTRAAEKLEALPTFPINSDLIGKQLGSLTFVAEVNVKTPSGGNYNASTIVLPDANKKVIFKKWTEGIAETQAQ